MATVNDFGDELPPPNKTIGSTGHVEDHNRISRELAEVQDVVKQLAIAYPNIRGSVSQEGLLPNPGNMGDIYVVGDGDLYAWNQTTSKWVGVGNFKGEQGLTGSPGTIVGKLAYGATPPAGTVSGTLWWVADSGTTPPTADTTPGYIGVSSGSYNGYTSSISTPGGGVVTGDIGIMALMLASNTRTANVSGWTEITGRRAVLSNSTFQLFYRVMQTGDGAFTITHTAGSGSTSDFIAKAAHMMVFRNVTLTGGSDVQQFTIATPSATTFPQTVPQVTPTSNAITVSWFVERVDYTTADVAYTIGSPMNIVGTSGLNQAGIGIRCNVAGAYDINYYSSGARPTGPPNWTRTGTNAITTTNSRKITIALTKAT